MVEALLVPCPIPKLEDDSSIAYSKQVQPPPSQCNLASSNFTCVHRPVFFHTSPCRPCVYALAYILRTPLHIDDYNSVRHHMAPGIGRAVLQNLESTLGQNTAQLRVGVLSSKEMYSELPF
jgi:hypothetical protein